jgi:hypothetical protein
VVAIEGVIFATKRISVPTQKWLTMKRIKFSRITSVDRSERSSCSDYVVVAMSSSAVIGFRVMTLVRLI